MPDFKNKTVAIRVDANPVIGSGHAMRCLSIAAALGGLGARAIFLVADADSRRFVQERGGEAVVLGGSFRHFGEADGAQLAKACGLLGAGVALVDSYAVSDGFFRGLRQAEKRVRSVYIDDLYTFEEGKTAVPVVWDVDGVVNYSFGADSAQYEKAYAGTETDCCIGVAYAPLRAGFADNARETDPVVDRILVTSGSTNPGGVLELMARACEVARPDAEVDVVVGGAASFNDLGFKRVLIHRGLTDLSALMRGSDLVVSAAGTTLYELCAVGVPTIAVPVVDNQRLNAKGFRQLGLGPVVEMGCGFSEKLMRTVCGYANDYERRKCDSKRMRQMVDGRGAARLAELLISFCSY